MITWKPGYASFMLVTLSCAHSITNYVGKISIWNSNRLLRKLQEFLEIYKKKSFCHTLYSYQRNVTASCFCDIVTELLWLQKREVPVSVFRYRSIHEFNFCKSAKRFQLCQWHTHLTLINVIASNVIRRQMSIEECWTPYSCIFNMADTNRKYSKISHISPPVVHRRTV